MSTLMGLENSGWKLGFQPGGLIGYEFSDRFALQLEAYSPTIKGATQEFNEESAFEGFDRTINSTWTSYYADGQLTFHYLAPIDRKGVYPYGPFGRNVYLDFFAGGYGSYHLGTKMEGTVTGSAVNPFTQDTISYVYDTLAAVPMDMQDAITPYDFGAVGGFGIKMHVGRGRQKRGRLFANVRYMAGLMSVDYGTFAELEGGRRRLFQFVFNHSVQFNIGAAISLESKSNRIR